MLTYQFRPIDQWPGEKTKSRKKSQFSASWSATLDKLESELKHLRAKDIVIQAGVTSAEIRNDGMLRSTARASWPGVILSFSSKHGELSYPCDTYTDWQANVRAIALALEALRTVDRYGVTRRAEQYQGWARLPAPPITLTSIDNAVSVLVKHAGGDTASQILKSREHMETAYRKCCTWTHPDRFPDKTQEFKDIQTAKEILDKYFESIK